MKYSLLVYMRRDFFDTRDVPRDLHVWSTFFAPNASLNYFRQLISKHFQSVVPCDFGIMKQYSYIVFAHEDQMFQNGKKSRNLVQTNSHPKAHVSYKQLC